MTILHPWLLRLLAAALAVTMASADAQRPDSGPLRIAAASDLQAALPELVRLFEGETGTKTSVSFGASGTFVAQVANGAPFDLFFSADLEYPKRLVADGHADADSLYQYARGRIVVWTRNDSGVRLDQGLASLNDARVKRVAVANPAQAPYGRAAVAALQSAGLYETLRPKIVFGENISQTAQLADSGNADAGILALSLARGPVLSAHGTHVEIPATAHSPIEQGVVILSRSPNKAAAQALLTFLKRPDVVERLRAFGFEPAR